ncbi:MAG: DUF547 domain-containing protein [Verrucomicrobiales bacterium]|nr:DUF547 domain-containing protein [Verrucomicrobiales bacterium]
MKTFASVCILTVILAVAFSNASAQKGSSTKSRATKPSGKSSSPRDSSNAEPGLVQVPKNIDHRPFELLLKKYVDEHGLVKYGAWKNSEADLTALRRYTEQFSRGESFSSGEDRAASLINAYNAFTIRWILENYPVPSIWETKEPFKAKRHLIGGQTVSLDDIEKQTLVPLIGYREHATVVCAARSCPPLRREAYRGDVLEKQLDEAMRFWLARDDLNHFDPQKREAQVSSVFKWFKDDFGGQDEGIVAVLAKYAPAQYQEFLRSPGVKVDYLEYDWGLNDQGEQGRNYRRGLLKKLFR